MEDKLIIKGIEFNSRLWVGTGKYKDFEETARAIEASGADVVTVAVRRTNITDRKSENLLDFIDPKNKRSFPIQQDVIISMPSDTQGSQTGSDMVKIEDQRQRPFPDVIGLLKRGREGAVSPAATTLLWQRLVDAGAAAVMPLPRRSAQDSARNRLA
jgi:thiazole synthase